MVQPVGEQLQLAPLAQLIVQLPPAHAPIVQVSPDAQSMLHSPPLQSAMSNVELSLPVPIGPM
jgi:hypothetical protein